MAIRKQSYSEAAESVTCQWYALCENVTQHVVTHPVIGFVAICSSCTDRHNLASCIISPTGRECSCGKVTTSHESRFCAGCVAELRLQDER